VISLARVHQAGRGALQSLAELGAGVYCTGGARFPHATMVPMFDGEACTFT
jgi:hypothetical protein